MSQFTDAEIFREAGRRRRALARSKPKTLRPCPKCEHLFGAREMRKHTPGCKGKQK